MKMWQHINDLQVVVTVGAGGVGKTTIAAAIGLYAALQGKKVMVVTIDPAMRLATALGIESIGGKPLTIDLKPLHKSCTGSLDIMMLDSTEVFRSLIQRNISNLETQHKILSNSFFKKFTEAMAGTQEHAAIEKLYELVESAAYDMIILDTPPSGHAIEFLNSPTRLLNVLDDTVLKWLVKPASSGLSMISFGGKYISKVLSLFAGAEMLVDLTEFIVLLSDQLAGFRERAASVERLLKDNATGYIAIASPERHAIEGAIMFEHVLTEQGYSFRSTIINRVWEIPEHPLTKDLLRRKLKKHSQNLTLPQDFAYRAWESYMHLMNVARIHRLKGHQLMAMSNLNHPTFYVRALVDDVVTIQGIYAIAKLLFRSKDHREELKEN